MKLLLTSAGIKSTSIHNALVELLGNLQASCRRCGKSRSTSG
jgi:hypothetical protein